MRVPKIVDRFMVVTGILMILSGALSVLLSLVHSNVLQRLMEVLK